MAHISKDENLDKLRGSELHHDLKNRPGEEGNPNHMNDGKTLKPKSDEKDADKA
ncbi:hypothetical protein HKCCE4037_13430 [Rhodobacterales bacterium HKCCE4037]|nr:hypothetical protein [Rhodobacterales bacterium HKCCE4037]